MKTAESIEISTDFRLFLQTELVRRCNANKNYSLRAFARSLDINHATLSSILAATRPLTAKSIIKLARALRLTQIDTNNFLKINEHSGRQRPTTDHHALAHDTFAIVSEWYHDAILELTHTRNFKPDYKWISRRLGVSTVEVRAAAERLARVGLLEMHAEEWVDLSRNNTTNTSNDLSSASLRQLQKKVLEMSLEALANKPRTQRDHTSLVVAMQKSDLEQVKKKIKAFRFELVKFIERKSAHPDSVFQFAFSAFPLTRNEEDFL